MALLPNKKNSVRRFAGGGGLGYESQLGGGLGNTGLGKVGDALYQNLPPLAVPYVDVKMAAPIDTAAAVAAADAEGQKQADKLKDEYQKLYNEATKDAKMTASDKADLARRYTGVLEDLQQQVTTNPLYFGSQANRVAFQNKLLNTLDQGDIQGKVNRYKLLEDTRTQLEKDGELDDQAVVNGRRLPPGVTYRTYLNQLFTQQDESQLAHLVGEQLPEGAPFGHVAQKLMTGLESGLSRGTFKDTQDTLRSIQGLIKTSENGNSWSREGAGRLKLLTGIDEERLLHQGGSGKNISNADIISGAKRVIQAQGWRAFLGSPKAVAGLEKAKNQQADNVPLRSDVTLANGQVLPAGTSRQQAETLAYQTGDEKTYRYLLGKREDLVNDMALQYLDAQLNLGLVHGHTSSSEQSWGGKTGPTESEGDDPGKLDIWGRIAGKDQGLDYEQVQHNDVEGSYQERPSPLTGKKERVFVPTASTYKLTRLPMADQAQMEQYIKTGAGSDARRKTLGEFAGNASSVLAAPGRPLKLESQWKGGLDADKWEVTGYEGTMYVPDARFTSEFARIKQYDIRLQELLQNQALNPAQRAQLSRLKAFNDNVKEELQVPYHVVRVSSDVRSLESANDYLAYKDKTGKTVKPLGQWQAGHLFNSDSPIAANNPYDLRSLSDSDSQASTKGNSGLGSYLTNNRSVNMRVLVRNDNAAYNDPSGMRATYDQPAKVKQYVNQMQTELDRFMSGRPTLK